MGIKWEDVKVGVSPLTKNMYIGKFKNGVWTDKSDDMTVEIVAAVVEKLMTKESKSITLLTADLDYTLTLTTRKHGEK